MNEETISEFVSIADDAFDIAVGIVKLAKLNQLTGAELENRQKQLSAKWKQWTEFKHRSEVWAIWPHKPTSFGQYQNSGSCAVEVAIQFAETIWSAIEGAKVASLSRFKVEPGDTEAFETWAKAVTVELQTTTLDLGSWTMAALRRDSQLLRHAIRAEFGEVVKNSPQETDKKTDNSKNPTSISSDARSIAKAYLKAKQASKSATQKDQITKYILQYPKKKLKRSYLEKQVREAVKQLKAKPDK